MIYLEDCVDGMSQHVESDSVDLVCTSPPYHLGKEYEVGVSNKQFEDMMHWVFGQIKRTLKPGGYFVVNFGDCFNSGNRFYEAEVPSVYPASLWYWNWGREFDLDLQATRIWRKKFAKLSIPFVCNNHPRNVFDYEHIWTFRKKGGEEVVHNRKLSQRGVLGDGWDSAANLAVHCAAFPVELPLWAIDVYSKEDDLVLDPFTGSGTTAVAALSRGRRFVGFEKDASHFKYAQERVGKLTDSVVEFK